MTPDWLQLEEPAQTSPLDKLVAQLKEVSAPKNLREKMRAWEWTDAADRHVPWNRWGTFREPRF